MVTVVGCDGAGLNLSLELVEGQGSLGGGQDYPIAAIDSDAGQQLNRRMAIGVAGELRNDVAMKLPSTALFEPNGATLSAASEQQFKGYGDEVKSTPGRVSRSSAIPMTWPRARRVSSLRWHVPKPYVITWYRWGGGRLN